MNRKPTFEILLISALVILALALLSLYVFLRDIHRPNPPPVVAKGRVFQYADRPLKGYPPIVSSELLERHEQRKRWYERWHYGVLIENESVDFINWLNSGSENINGLFIESRFTNNPTVTIQGLTALLSFTNLEYLALTNCRFESSEFGFLGSLTHLESLVLSNCGLNDEGMKEIGKLKNLRTLDLAYNNITADGLADLKPLELISLRVHLPKGDGRSLNMIATLSSLEGLEYDGGTQPVDLTPFAGHPNLAYLAIMSYGGHAWSDSSINALLKCPRLKKLRLEGAVINIPQLEKLLKSGKLSHLNCDVSLNDVPAAEQLRLKYKRKIQFFYGRYP